MFCICLDTSNISTKNGSPSHKNSIRWNKEQCVTHGVPGAGGAINSDSGMWAVSVHLLAPWQ